MQAPEAAAPLHLLLQTISLTHTDTQSWLGLSWSPIGEIPRLSPSQTHMPAGLTPWDLMVSPAAADAAPDLPKWSLPLVSTLETPPPLHLPGHVTCSLAYLAGSSLVITRKFPQQQSLQVLHHGHMGPWPWSHPKGGTCISLILVSPVQVLISRLMYPPTHGSMPVANTLTHTRAHRRASPSPSKMEFNNKTEQTMQISEADGQTKQAICNATSPSIFLPLCFPKLVLTHILYIHFQYLWFLP